MGNRSTEQKHHNARDYRATSVHKCCAQLPESAGTLCRQLLKMTTYPSKRTAESSVRRQTHE
ncbi:hypothetical protein ARZXY2_4472 (plasmid) [Arthrobacter sp. ZXY-2]|nr:hypothetical protein ARZXY2_4472 [Arthrobacter sp. ZXY-2]